tara:strand:- start:239 stop:691 length:453 start_codon:yes stop_codon:yes gene_type:complete
MSNIINRQLTDKEEAFCQAISIHGKDKKLQAYKDAGYSQNMTEAKMGIQADKTFNKPRITLRLDELMVVVNKVAEEKFTVSVQQRLKWLQEITEFGMEEIIDAQGVSKRQNLQASRSAIETLNTMLGVSEDSGKTKPVKVFVGVQDASRK